MGWAERKTKSTADLLKADYVTGRFGFPNDGDEYAEALHALTTSDVYLDFVDAYCRVTYPLPLEASHNDWYELIWKAKLKGIGRFKLARLLARQTVFYKDESAPEEPIRVSFLDYINAQNSLKKSGRDIPFIVGQTVGAILLYNIPDDICPRKFKDNIEELVDHETFTRSGIPEGETKDGRKEATLAGTTLVEIEDSSGDVKLLMRRKKHGPYTGRFSMAGGRSDWLGDITALRELVEETGAPWNIVGQARPLGTVDNTVAMYNGRVKRYINLVWSLKVYSERLNGVDWPVDEPNFSPWEQISSYELSELASNSQLTPIALCALRLKGYEV